MTVIGSPTPVIMKIAPAKKKNLFKASFCDTYGSHLPYSDQLSQQVLRVSDILQTSYGGVNDIEVVFEDDLDNLCCEALQNLFNENAFIVKVELLDSNNQVKRTYTLSGCAVVEIVHGSLDYVDREILTKTVLISVNGIKIS